METIINDVKEIVANALDLEMSEFENDSDLYNDLGADSVIGFEISVKLQRKFKITVKPEDISKLTSVDKIAEYIQENSYDLYD